MKNTWESTVTIGNAILWGATLTTGGVAAYALFWVTLWVRLAAETLLAVS